YECPRQSTVRYPYDPRKAKRLIGELGYAPAPGGGFAAAGGVSLGPIEVWSSNTELYVKTATITASLWKQFGLDTTPFTVPNARATDAEFRTSFTGFEAVGGGTGLGILVNLRASG